MDTTTYTSLEEATRSIQKYITENYSKTLNKIKKEKNDKAKTLIKNYIENYIIQNNIKVQGYEIEQLIEFVYKEMTTFSFLEQYLYDKEIEEINILDYKTIRITKNDGTIENSKETFLSPQNCRDIIARLLQKSNITFSKSQPIAEGYLNDQTRIKVFSAPIYDEKLGLGASIRVVNPKKLKYQNFIDCEEATEEMLYTLNTLYLYGTSILLSGSTGSGKTTLMIEIMSKIEPWKRLITIETKTREFNLIERDEKGMMTNNVIHLLTKESNNKEYSIEVEQLLQLSLDCNPDYMCLSQMIGNEAMAVVKACNTGHPILSTVHSNNAEQCYPRMLTLCKPVDNLDDKTLMLMITQGFPIVAYCQEYKNTTDPYKRRKIVKIIECIGLKDTIPITRTLYRYKILKSTLLPNSKKEIIGKFIKENNPSEALKEKLINNGATEEEINKIWTNLENIEEKPLEKFVIDNEDAKKLENNTNELSNEEIYRKTWGVRT